MIAQIPAQPTVRIRKFPAETILLVAVCILVAFGLLVVFDASYPMSLGSKLVKNDPLYFGKQQARGLIGGMLAMAIMIGYGYRRLRKFAGVGMAAGGVLLCLVWAPHLGVAKQHAARWVHLVTTFQPSEIAKLTLVLFLAHMLARPDCNIKHLTEGILAPLIAAAAYLVLIEREPDLGTTIVLFAAVMTMLYMAGARKRHIALILVVVPILFLAKGGLKSGQMERVHVFLDQGRSARGPAYQTHHSMLAIGSGELAGVGWGAGHEKFYLPEANSDFIFATIGEELGFVGSSFVLLLFGVISWAGLTIAKQSTDPYGRLLAIGLTALITWQAVINIAVVTVSIPATGVPLPFISYGSTSLILMMTSVGVLYSIAQDSHAVRAKRK